MVITILKKVIRAGEVKPYLPEKHIACDTRKLIAPETTGSKKIVLCRSEFKAGGYAGEHTHPFEQAYYILKGCAKVKIGTEQFDVSEGDAIFFPAGEVHSITNTGNGELWLIAINSID